MHAAAAMLAITYPFWSKPQWWEQVISVLPNLLGFTLGGFAMFLGFGNDRFKSEVAKVDPDGPPGSSIFVGLCATFVHFILLQSLALLWAFVIKAWYFEATWPDCLRPSLPYLNVLGGAVGYGLFLYACMSIVAATMHVFRIATMFETIERFHADTTEQSQTKDGGGASGPH